MPTRDTGRSSRFVSGLLVQIAQVCQFLRPRSRMKLTWLFLWYIQMILYVYDSMIHVYLFIYFQFYCILIYNISSMIIFNSLFIIENMHNQSDTRFATRDLDIHIFMLYAWGRFESIWHGLHFPIWWSCFWIAPKKSRLTSVNWCIFFSKPCNHLPGGREFQWNTEVEQHLWKFPVARSSNHCTTLPQTEKNPRFFHEARG